MAIMDDLNNPTPLIKKGSDLYNGLSSCYNLWIISTSQDNFVTRYKATYISKQLVEWFEKKTKPAEEGKPAEPMKYILFSAHDFTFVPFLSIPGLLKYQCLVDCIETGKMDPKCTGSPPTAS